MNMDNSVLKDSTNLSVRSRKLPGLYMILCVANDYRYYGETSSLSGRIASHKSMLRRRIHPNENLQKDWNIYGEAIFKFVVLYIGEDWRTKSTRLTLESQLIAQNSETCYNVFESYELRVADLNPFYQKKHSAKTKLLMSSIKKGIPNDALGAKVSIDGKIFPSIAQASRELGHCHKLLRTRVDSADFPHYKRIVDF
jgi:hypothetical protein